MKIIKDDVCYVQVIDILNLIYFSQRLNELGLNYEYPISIKNRFENILKEENYNMDDFIAFTNEDELNFFQGETNILDYEKFLALSNRTLKQICNSIIQQRDSLNSSFRSMTYSSDTKIKSCYFARYDFMTYQLNEVLKFIDLKEGNIYFDLPNNVKYPKRNLKKRNIN